MRREVRHCLDPSSDILMPLLDYQRQFLWWAVTQEKGDMRGGILADEVSAFGVGEGGLPSSCEWCIPMYTCLARRWAWARPSKPSPSSARTGDVLAPPSASHMGHACRQVTDGRIGLHRCRRFDDQFQELTPEGLRESGVDWDPAPFSLLKRGGKAEGGEGTEAGASGVGSQPATTSAGDGAVKEEGEEKAAGKARRGGKKKPVKEPPVTTWEVERPRVEDDGCNGEPCCKATLGEGRDGAGVPVGGG